MKQNQQITELFILRALAILGVVMVHSTSFATVELESTSAFYPLYNFLNRFFAFGTATFIFLSAFVLFYSYFQRPFARKSLKKFYLKRLKFVILPYVIFSAIYFTLISFPFSNSNFLELGREFLFKLATGKAYDHLYFIFVLIQFDLLFPLLLWFFKNYKSLLKHGIWFGFLLQWAFVFLNNYYLHIAVGTGSIAFSYMSHYFLGAFMGIYFRQFIVWLKGWKRYLLVGLWLFSGAFYVWIYYVMRVDNVYYNAKWYTFLWNFYTYTAVLVLFLLSFWLYKKLPVRLLSRLMHLGACSFGIYLFHPLVLRIYRKFDFSAIPCIYHLSVFCGFASALLISWFVVKIVNKYFPYAWTLFGRSQSESGKKYRFYANNSNVV